MAQSKNRARARAATHENAVIGSVRSILTGLLATGYPDLPTVAREVGIPVRTLQRRLADAGLTYSDLVTEARFDRARELLGDRSRKIGEIASALGYSDPANFTRAFKKLAGMTPAQYRESVTGTPPS